MIDDKRALRIILSYKMYIHIIGAESGHLQMGSPRWAEPNRHGEE
jgi:hypothetical protein